MSSATMTTAVPMRSPKRMPQPVRSQAQQKRRADVQERVDHADKAVVMPCPKIIGRNFILRRSDQMKSISIGQPTIISFVRGRQ